MCTWAMARLYLSPSGFSKVTPHPLFVYSRIISCATDSARAPTLRMLRAAFVTGPAPIGRTNDMRPLTETESMLAAIDIKPHAVTTDCEAAFVIAIQPCRRRQA